MSGGAPGGVGRALLRWGPLPVAVALVVPALGSALYLDDWIYLTGARAMASTPLSELAALQLPFLGETVSAHQATHAWGAWVWVFGADPPDAAMQAGSLLWLIAAVAGAAWTTRALRPDGPGAGWLLLACPPLLILAHRIMPDLPYTALCLVALGAFVAAGRASSPRGRWAAAAALALAATAAWLVAYQALALLAAATLAVVALPAGRRLPAAAGLGVAWAAFVAGQAYSGAVLGTPHLLLAGAWFSGSVDTSGFTPAWRALALLGYLGAFGAPALALFFLRAGGWNGATRSTAGVALGALALQIALAWLGVLPAVVDSAWHALAVAAGAAQLWVLAIALLGAVRDLDAGRGAAAGWGLAAFLGAVVLLPAPLARYLLPVHAAVAVVAASWPVVARQGLAFRLERAVAVAIALVWIGLGLALAQADAARADATARLVQRLPVEEGTYFVGESGFRVAAERRGMRYLLRADEAPDARLLHSDVQTPETHRVHPALWARLGQPGPLRETYLAPVSAVDWDRGADFYFPWSGAVPFTFPGVGEVGAATQVVAAPLPPGIEAGLTCLEQAFVPGRGWPAHVRWTPDGPWEEIHSVFPTTEVVLGLASLPDHPRVRALAERGLAELIADRNDDGSWCFYGRPDRIAERPGMAWEITPDADDTARAMLALRAWGRPVEPAALAALAAQVEPDGSVRTWYAPPAEQVRTDSDRPDPVIAAVVLRALEGTPHEAERARIRVHLAGVLADRPPDETTYYGGRRVRHEIELALGQSAPEDWLPPGKPAADGCLPLQTTFYGAEEAGRPEYGSVAGPTVSWMVGAAARGR